MEMRARPSTSIVLSICVVCGVLASAPTADAAFPGSDGRLVFSYEAPVPREGLTQSDLFTMNPDGGDLLQLTYTRHRNELAAAWDPTGSRLAFQRTPTPFGHGSIWVMDADGSAPTQLTHGIDARDPAWSPNGRRIAFTMFGPGTDVSIYTMRASDGGGLRRITTWGSQEFEPAWSPDGGQLAFTRGYERGDVGDLWVIDVRTGEARRITTSPTYDHQVSWTSNGRRLIFQRTRINTSKIASIRPTGRGLILLTSGHFDTGPAPSPLGTRIAFESDRDTDFLPDLWIMDADGTHLERIADLPFASTMADWQPVP
jgi:TolB protein